MPRKALFNLAVAAALTTAYPTSSAAGQDDLVIVVNPANHISRLSKSDLRPIFQTSRTTWPGGERIAAVNQPESSSARKVFDQVVLDMTNDEVVKYWTDRKIRGGARPPRRLPNGAAVARFVSTEVGAIGYVARSDVGEGLKMVAAIRRGAVVSP
jgi:ABC-type phosphate transport system substrate-binding protein